MAYRGRPKKVQPDHLPVLREIVTDEPLATLTELRDAFAARIGISLYIGTLRKALKEAGIMRQKGALYETTDHGDPTPEKEPPARYGYEERHRQQAPEQRYPSCLTNAEWERVADIFESDGDRGLAITHKSMMHLDWQLGNQQRDLLSG